MKKILLLAVSLFSFIHGHAQALTHEQRLADLGRVWGFLKYFHPAVAGGQYNWDDVLIRKIAQLEKLPDAEAVNAFYTNWLDELGEVKKCRSCSAYTDDDMTTAGLSWLKENPVLNTTLRARLLDVLQNRYHGKPFYLSNKGAGNIEMMNEPKYEMMAYPSMEYRLLGLYRYWNAVQYFFPYKKDIGEDWNKVLDEMIIPFRDAGDTLAYQAAIWQLAARINDSHGVGVCAPYVPSCGSPLFGVRMAPLSLQWTEKETVVVRLGSDSLCRVDDIRVGDIIKKIDGRTPQQIIDANWLYIGGSTERGRYRNNVATLLHGNSPVADVVIERDGKLMEKKIHRYPWEEIKPWMTPSKEGMWKMLEEGVGYIHMGRLKQDSIKEIMNALKDTRAIVLDIRNYPQGTAQQLSRYTHPKATPFVYATVPQTDRPGLFEKSKDFLCGTQNKQPYKGKLILLVNESTQSHAEFSTMLLQTAPAVVTIGNQTAGADGNVSTIVFPGGYSTMMSGLGVYYPDGTPTQRVGVRVDITVTPTLAAVLKGRDEIQERALQYIHTGK